MLLTTNLDREQLEAQIGARTVSRLYEMCGTPLPMFDGDHRMPGRYDDEPASVDEDAMWEGAAPSRYGRRAGGA
jgi:hypothetical protein